MLPLDAYLRELSTLHESGVATTETSYYPALKALLDAVGRTLKPPVRCVANPRSVGQGIPDLGLYTPDQLQRAGPDTPRKAVIPARGVMEVKGTAQDVALIAESAQVKKYLERYRQVLVTNYREFQLVALDDHGLPAKLERYQLAPDERAFWAAAADPHAVAVAHAGDLAAYLTRMLLHAAPLATPRDVAATLAGYARIALSRVERADLPALTAVRTAFEQALGITFEGQRGDHFFRSTLVQTLFYGIFSAWVLWSKQPTSTSGERFDWMKAGWTLQVPVISFLFEQVAQPSRLRPLGLVEVLGWTGDALQRVDRETFFARFEESHAVQYFYEPFLEEFDPALRRELGVWYTPTEIVEYMVACVDVALREDLGIADGLADPNVYILDPCCGTGAYLVEVIRRIHARTAETTGDALAGHDLKQDVLRRVFGFELLPAPFVVAHLQLGLLLQRLDAPLRPDRAERVGVFLTNALTGWQPAKEPKQRLFPELQQERDAAEQVKQHRPILVILGNPPYNGYAGVAVGEERDLTEAYRKARGTREPQGQGLNDLYVRFYRMAERRIVEGSGRGIVCYISNYSWLDGLSFTAMRERYLDAFSRIQIDSLNGDKYKTGKRAPDGQPDPSVFSTEWNHEGIQVGTAIVLLVRQARHTPATAVRFRQFWGKHKRRELLESIAAPGGPAYDEVTPPAVLGYPFMPLAAAPDYGRWPMLPDLFPAYFPGVKTSRDDVVVDVDRDRLIARMRQYFDPAIGHEQMRRIAPGAMESTARFQAEAVRDQLRRRGFLPNMVVRYCYRPFDLRWLYWEPETKLLDEKRSEYFPQVFEGNIWLSGGQRNRKEAFYAPQVTRVLADHHIVESNVGLFPLYLRSIAEPTLFDLGTMAGPRSNLSAQAADYLAQLGANERDLFYHVLCMLHSPAYQLENAGALRQDWPRIPLPNSLDALRESAALGRRLADLFDVQAAVPGVAPHATRPELRCLGAIQRVGGGALDPATDLAVTAGWGFAGQGGVTMAGKGRAVERAYTPEEVAALAEGLDPMGLGLAHGFALLGPCTHDIYLNEIAYWRNVPSRVWDYTLGGYQVLKKWLSYRELDLLKRPLTAPEAREVTRIVARIAAILLLGPVLDATYHAIRQQPHEWRTVAPAQPSLLDLHAPKRR